MGGNVCPQFWVPAQFMPGNLQHSGTLSTLLGSLAQIGISGSIWACHRESNSSKKVQKPLVSLCHCPLKCAWFCLPTEPDLRVQGDPSLILSLSVCIQFQGVPGVKTELRIPQVKFCWLVEIYLVTGIGEERTVGGELGDLRLETKDCEILSKSLHPVGFNFLICLLLRSHTVWCGSEVAIAVESSISLTLAHCKSSSSSKFKSL